MQIVVSGRHLAVTEAIRTYVQEKFGKLPKFFDHRVASIEVTLETTHGKHHVKAVVHVEHSPPVIAEAETDDCYASVDACVLEAERQLKKHKEMIRNDRKHSGETLRNNGGHV